MTCLVNPIVGIGGPELMSNEVMVFVDTVMVGMTFVISVVICVFDTTLVGITFIGLARVYFNTTVVGMTFIGS